MGWGDAMGMGCHGDEMPARSGAPLHLLSAGSECRSCLYQLRESLEQTEVILS